MDLECKIKLRLLVYIRQKKRVDNNINIDKTETFGIVTASVETVLTVPYANKNNIKNRNRYSIVKKVLMELKSNIEKEKRKKEL